MKLDLSIKIIGTLIIIIGSLLTYQATMVLNSINNLEDKLILVENHINELEKSYLIYVYTGKNIDNPYDVRDSLAHEFDNEGNLDNKTIELLLKLIETK